MPESPLKLSEEERELLMTEVAQALDQVRAPGLRAQYGELLTAVDGGEVPEDLLDPLQTLLEVGLESGRIRRVHLAHAEMAAQRLYARTPRGRMVQANATEVNRALAALAGHTVESVRVAPAGPGRFHLTLTTDEGTLLLQFSRGGIEIKSLEVG